MFDSQKSLEPNKDTLLRLVLDSKRYKKLDRIEQNLTSRMEIEEI